MATRRAGRHRLDGPPRRAGSRRHQRRPPRRAALCRRPHLARDGNAQAGLAAGAPAGGLGPHRALLRPARLPDLARHRQHRPLGLLHRLQVDLSRPRGRWDEAYFRGIGLGALADEGFRRIGTEIRPMGGAVGPLSTRPPAPSACRRHPGRRLGDRRPRRRHRHHRRRPRRGRAGRRRAAAPPGARRRHVELPHGGLARPALRAGRLGSLLSAPWCRGSG